MRQIVMAQKLVNSCVISSLIFKRHPAVSLSALLLLCSLPLQNDRFVCGSHPTLEEEESRSIYADQITETKSNSNQLGKHVTILAAPLQSDHFYQDQHQLQAVINFQRHFAQQLLAVGENVLILVPKVLHNYYTKSQGALHKGLPEDVLISASLIRGLYLRDYAPIGTERPIQFSYQPLEMPEYLWQNITGAFRQFELDTGLHNLIQHSSNLILEGDNVVDNGEDYAVISSRVNYDNLNKFKDEQIAIMLADGLGVKTAAVISELSGEPLGHAGRMVAFIEPEVLVVADLPNLEWKRMLSQLQSAFNDHMPLLVKIRNFIDERSLFGTSASCGCYINMLVTESHVFLPQFAADPYNRQLGLKQTVDHEILSIVQKHTKKQVVPVQVPHAVCRLGGSLRRMTWQLKGQQGDWLMAYATAAMSGKKLRSVH